MTICHFEVWISQGSVFTYCEINCVNTWVDPFDIRRAEWFTLLKTQTFFWEMLFEFLNFGPGN